MLQHIRMRYQKTSWLEWKI